MTLVCASNPHYRKMGALMLTEPVNHFDRRGVLNAGLLAMASMFARDAFAASTAPAKPALPPSEADNIRLVSEFFAGWQSGSDAEVLGRFMAPDCTIRLGPPYVTVGGRNAAVALFKVLIDEEREKRVIERMQPFGPLVLNIRTAAPSLPRSRHSNRLVGVFVIESGQIREWSDYIVPHDVYFF